MVPVVLVSLCVPFTAIYRMKNQSLFEPSHELMSDMFCSVFNCRLLITSADSLDQDQV